jgi:hypothetical protein
VSYYQLAEVPETDDTVHDAHYKDWLNSLAPRGRETTSVILRLVCMFEENKPLFEEFQALIGPGGLGLVEFVSIGKVDLSEMARTQPILPGKMYLPVFALPKDVGGGGGRNLFQFSKLSSGTRRAIQLVVAILFDDRSLMLLEHPEDSIHPGLLRKIIDLLRSYSHASQILFSTHSPNVLDILRPEEAILVTAEKGETIARRLASREISAAKKFLNDEGSLSEYLEPLDGSS